MSFTSQVVSINLWEGPGGSVPPPLPIPSDTGEECGREAALGSGAAEGREGRQMGTGTDLLLAVVAPMPGTGYVFNKSLLDDIRDERGRESGGGRETRTILALSRQPESLPFLPYDNLYKCGGVLAPSSLSNELWKSWRAQRKLLCGLQTYNLVFKPTSREVYWGQREPTLCSPTLSKCGAHTQTHAYTLCYTNSHTHSFNSFSGM